jgi:hypothetical protein
MSDPVPGRTGRRDGPVAPGDRVEVTPAQA